MNEHNNGFVVCTKCITYNHASYIEDTLSGFVIQQTNFPVVFTIIDDASTDGEQDVLKEWAINNLETEGNDECIIRKMPYGRLIYGRYKTKINLFFAILLLSENHYRSGKSSLKINYISEWFNSSTYIAYCEGDDYWTDPQHLNKMVIFLEEHKDYSMCFSDVKNYSQKDRKFVSSPIVGYDNSHLPVRKKELFYYILLGKCKIQTLTVLFRASGLKNIERNDVEFMMGDTPLWLDLSQVGKIEYFPEIHGVYRITGSSASRNPSTIRRFNLSMFEMRVYYCIKYGYEVPLVTKRKYNKYLIDCSLSSGFEMDKALYPLFPMNFFQTSIYRIAAHNNCVVKRIIQTIWKIESRIFKRY